MAITRLWFFTLQPPLSATDPTFTQLWADVLELCATYSPSPGPSTLHAHVTLLSQSCPKRPHHFLFQCFPSGGSSSGKGAEAETRDGKTRQGDVEERADEPPLFVLISTYPSFALCAQADAAYSQSLKPRVFAAVRHHTLRQIDLEDAEVVPALLSRRASTHRSSAAKTTSSSRSNGHHPDAGGGGGGGGLDGVAQSSGEADGGGSGNGNGNGNRSEDGAEDDVAPSITVTISSRDPLRSEVVEAMHSPGPRSHVPPPDQEMSGADVYVPPPPPLVSGHAGAEEDLWAKQRKEGKKWVRISRHTEAVAGDGDIEVYRLKELMSR